MASTFLYIHSPSQVWIHEYHENYLFLDFVSGVACHWCAGWGLKSVGFVSFTQGGFYIPLWIRWVTEPLRCLRLNFVHASWVFAAAQVKGFIPHLYCAKCGNLTSMAKITQKPGPQLVDTALKKCSSVFSCSLKAVEKIDDQCCKLQLQPFGVLAVPWVPKTRTLGHGNTTARPVCKQVHFSWKKVHYVFDMFDIRAGIAIPCVGTNLWGHNAFFGNML